MVILSTNPLFSSSRSPLASVSKPPTFPVSSLTNLSLHLLPFNLSLPIVPYLRARAQFPPPLVCAPSPCVKAHVRLWVCACVKAHGQSGLCFLGDNNSLNSCRQTWRVHAQCVCARASVCLGMERRRAPREAPLSPNKNHRVGSNTHTQQRRRVSRWSQSASCRQQAGLIHVNSCFRCQFVCSRQSSLSDHQRGDLKRTH